MTKYVGTHFKKTVNTTVPTEVKSQVVSGLDIKLRPYQPRVNWRRVRINQPRLSSISLQTRKH